MHSHTHGDHGHSHGQTPTHEQTHSLSTSASSNGGHAPHSHSHSHTHEPPPPPPPYAPRDDDDGVASDSNQTEAHHQATVIATFDSYRRVSLSANQRRRADYFQLSPEHRRLLPGYAELLNQVDGLLGTNAEFLQAVIAENPFPPETEVVDAPAPQEADHERLRSTLRSVARDWTVEGTRERDTTYSPILQMLEELYGHLESEDRAKVQVLVPGAGLGRLAWEIVNAGFSCQANEFSLYMLIVSSYILNHTTSIDAYSVYPYLHSFSNARTNADLLAPLRVPDVDPSTIATTSLGDFSFAAGDFLEIYSQPSQQNMWDVIATCFFIDTAKNIVEYLERIWGLLKDGGVWINCGPTLWHFENTEGSSSIELSLEDVKTLAKRMGFRIENEHEVQTSYTSNPRSMLRHEYTAAFWTATKGSRN